MDVLFVGVGEAFDEALPNTSLLVAAQGREGRRTLLLDCGFSAPFAYWRLAPDPAALDGLCITHFHGDHFLGAPALVLRFWEEGRTRPLAVAGPPGVADKVCAALDLAYPTLRGRLGFPLEFAELEPGRPAELAGVRLSCAVPDHSPPCLALRLDEPGAALFYSGDGRPTPAAEALARGCGLAVHEAYGLEPDIPGHGTVSGGIAFARRAGVPRLALVHLNRQVRRHRRAEADAALRQAADLDAFLPEPGDAVTL
ncbi:MAG: MBL fold metallo-hydrolase [Thermodesulfobacteriota bacterium]